MSQIPRPPCPAPPRRVLVGERCCLLPAQQTRGLTGESLAGRWRSAFHLVYPFRAAQRAGASAGLTVWDKSFLLSNASRIQTWWPSHTTSRICLTEQLEIVLLLRQKVCLSKRKDLQHLVCVLTRGQALWSCSPEWLSGDGAGMLGLLMHLGTKSGFFLASMCLFLHTHTCLFKLMINHNINLT